VAIVKILVVFFLVTSPLRKRENVVGSIKPIIKQMKNTKTRRNSKIDITSIFISPDFLNFA
jgi:hypothetical protein